MTMLATPRLKDSLSMNFTCQRWRLSSSSSTKQSKQGVKKSQKVLYNIQTLNCFDIFCMKSDVLFFESSEDLTKKVCNWKSDRKERKQGRQKSSETPRHAQHETIPVVLCGHSSTKLHILVWKPLHGSRHLYFWLRSSRGFFSQQRFKAVKDLDWRNMKTRKADKIKIYARKICEKKIFHFWNKFLKPKKWSCCEIYLWNFSHVVPDLLVWVPGDSLPQLALRHPFRLHGGQPLHANHDLTFYIAVAKIVRRYITAASRSLVSSGGTYV